MKEYDIVFTFKKELDKSIMVQKKTKKINKIFFIPKSVIVKSNKYSISKNLWKDVDYKIDRISLLLPKWYCQKELGFYK